MVVDWQNRLDVAAAKKAENEKEAAAKKAENEKEASAAAAAKHEGSAHCEGGVAASNTAGADAVPAISGVGLDATLAPGRGLTDSDVIEFRNAAEALSAAKKDDKKGTRTEFAIGDDVLVPGKRRTDPKLKGRITKVLSKECWVEFDKTVAAVQNPAKYRKDKMEFAPEQDKAIVQPATEAAAGSAALKSSDAPVIEKVEELKDGDDKEEELKVAWQDCRNIFSDY